MTIEHAVSFNGEMMRAILSGEKTQTRRPFRHQPPADAVMRHIIFGEDVWGENIRVPGNRMGQRVANETIWRCPHGQPGHKLWARESWRVGAWQKGRMNGELAVDYRADGYSRCEWLQVENDEMFLRMVTQSHHDAEHAEEDAMMSDPDKYKGGYIWKPGDSPCRWRPSIHMPRWATRFTPTIISIRAERVQDIPEEDAESELDGYIGLAALCKFARIWESCYGQNEKLKWSANPWVWATEFERFV